MLRNIITKLHLPYSKSTPNKGTIKHVDSTIEELLQRRKKVRNDVRQYDQQNMLVNQQYKQYMDSVVKINLYMRQDCWRSQFVYLFLGYQQLGFRRVSDLEFLDRASYFLELDHLKEEEKWPAIKVVVALEPKVIVTGMEPIFDYFKSNGFFTEELTEERSQVASVEQYIDENVVPYLESLFWHPLLTYQYSFHTNTSSYEEITRDTFILSILRKNASLVGRRVLKNLASIWRERERYESSKDKLREGLLEVVKACLGKHQFLGGFKPGRLDFYLMALLRSKSGSSLFMRYLERDVGGQFWGWYVRVSSLCHYNPERVTFI